MSDEEDGSDLDSWVKFRLLQRFHAYASQNQGILEGLETRDLVGFIARARPPKDYLRNHFRLTIHHWVMPRLHLIAYVDLSGLQLAHFTYNPYPLLSGQAFVSRTTCPAQVDCCTIFVDFASPEKSDPTWPNYVYTHPFVHLKGGRLRGISNIQDRIRRLPSCRLLIPVPTSIPIAMPCLCGVHCGPG